MFGLFMDMEVVVPKPNDAITLQTLDFSFDSTASSPYITAPNSPQRFGNFYFSAPTSPIRARPSCFLHEDHDHTRNSVSSIPFGWEAKPGIPKDKIVDSHPDDDVIDDDDDDFEFEFSGQLDRASASASASADELFDGGKIKPLKPPPRLQNNPQVSASGPPVVSPRSPRSRFSPKKKGVQDFDPFAAALEQSTKTEQDTRFPKQRGRERKNGHSGSSSGSYIRKGTRSLSPLRVSDIVFEQEDRISRAPLKSTTTTTTSPSSISSSSSSGSYFSSLLSSISFSKGYRKWSFKDFLLFRSASEGRGTNKDPLRKYSVLSGKEDILNDVKNSSFRSSDGSVGGSKRRANVSAHEWHYTTNRAVSEEMKKKTFLPYKHGLLGCLGFNPGMHEIARGVGSLSRG